MSAEQKTKVMGIVNVTPDSFYDGAKHATLAAAIDHSAQLIAQGADLLDIGGESTRPGATPVGLQEELERVIPLIEALRTRFDIPLSIDTYKPQVMQAALEAGVSMVNDISGMRQQEARQVVAAYQADVCIMHMQGLPMHMQEAPHYEDGVVEAVRDFFQQQIAACLQDGIAKEKMILDPGIGFGKTLAHNLLLLKNSNYFMQLGVPVLIGASRKRMIGELLNQTVEHRLYGSLAVAAHAVILGVQWIRTHDVLATRELIDVLWAIKTTETIRPVETKQ